MNKQLTSIAVAGVVVAAATGSPSRTPATVVAGKAPTEQTGNTTGKESGTDLFIKRDISRAKTGTQLLDGYFQSKARLLRKGRTKPSLDVVIATLPDPLDSHLDYAYDTELGALRQAFETSGYVTDRFWLPWPLDREKADLAARNNRIDTTAYRQTNPGIVLFRDTSNTHLRLLYIVGEVPTSGINPAAVDQALHDRTRVLADPRVVSGSHTLRIVGPVFTGGGPALAEALARWRAGGEKDSIVVISGSATGDPALDSVRVPPPFSYRATVHSDAVLERVERNVLCELLQIPIAQIAQLRESSTQYGATPPDSAVLAQNHSSPSASTKELSRCSGKFLDIPFPANISSLRTEYARIPVSPPPEVGLGTGAAPRIPLNLQDPSRAMENPPVMSGLTPAILDVMLDELARTLVAHRIRAVGILATDTRDKLFLAEQLRARRRDLTLFTTESNVLLLRKEVNSAMRGMLVFATYPLQVDAQRWDTAGVGERRLAFANDAAEGIFNATRLQLAQNPWLAEYGAPGLQGAALYCEPGYRELRTNAPDSVPPVWVLAIGRSGYFPITACPTGNANHLMPTRPRGAPPPPPAYDAPVLVYPIIAIALISLVVLFVGLERRQFRFIVGKVPRMRPDTCMRGLDWELLLLQAHLYAILRVCALTALAAGLSVGIVHSLGDELHESTSLEVAAGVSLVTAFVIGIVRAGAATITVRRVLMLIGTERWPDDERRDRIYRCFDLLGRFLMVPVAVAYLVIGARFLLQVRSLGDISPLRQELFLHRAGELTGGYSPAMVLALTGAMFALWCSWHINRIEMLLTTPSAFENASLSGCGGAPTEAGSYRLARWAPFMRRTRTLLLVLMPDGLTLGAFVASLLLAVLIARAIAPSYETLLFQRYELPFETPGGVKLRITLFDVLARFGLTAALAASAWALLRTARVWQALRRTLDELGRTPRVTAFERLPRRIARLTRLNVIRPHAQKLVRTIAITQWSHMRRLYAAMSPEEQLELTDGIATVKLANGAYVPAPEYLEALMRGERVSAWEPDDFMAPKPPASSGKDEATAIRFLFEVTNRAHFSEPPHGDLEKVLARTEAKAEDGGPKSTSGHIRRTFGDTMRLWLRSAEELIAVQAVDYIRWVMQHLRYLTLYIVASLVILTELIWSYELHPVSTLWLLAILLVFAAVVVLLTVVVQMNRNEVLSRIAGTTPGTVTWDLPFVMNIAVIALVPIVTFIGAELPWLREGLYSSLNPVLRALGGH
ncbi:MAG TPA: hypothetical protein VF929_02915 [Gemmatimonadaceae bacterium]